MNGIYMSNDQINNTDILQEKYDEITAGGKKYYEVADIIDSIVDPKEQDDLRDIMLWDFLGTITKGYIFYDYSKPLFFEGEIRFFDEQILKFKKPLTDSDYLMAYSAFIHGDFTTCAERMKVNSNSIEELDGENSEIEIISSFIVPFKNAPEVIVDTVNQILIKEKTDPNLIEIYNIIQKYYRLSSKEDQINLLQAAAMKYPDSIAINDYLSFTYYLNKNWGNSVACFERMYDIHSVIYLEYDIDAMMGDCYWHLKEYKKACECYERALSYIPDAANVLNILGYCYYQDKNYDAALDCFVQCIEEKRDLPYAANNYLRTLLAIGDLEKAKLFIDNPPCHIAKEMVERYEKKLNKTSSHSPSQVNSQESAGDEEEDQENFDFATEEDQLAVLKNAKSEMQFSNEKLLEDELESRIVQGKTVFGKKLKIFRRPGAYGRQYIIPIGRLDLLAEDDNGNLYVIELKKDSGYDDPYIQTSDYVNWFEEHLPEGIENVYGIICLNSPSKKCIEDVKNDSRIDLYEYAITYTKVE